MAGVAVAGLVLVGTAAVAALFFALAWRTSGLLRIGYAALGCLVVWQSVRPTRPASTPLIIAEDESPGLHRLVEALKDLLGVQSKVTIGVDTQYGTHLVHSPGSRQWQVVIGLPGWTALDPRERIAVLAQHVAFIGITSRGDRFVEWVREQLLRWIDLLTPTPRHGRTRSAALDADADLGVMGPGQELAMYGAARGAMDAVGNTGLGIFSIPARGALALIDRLRRTRDLEHTYRADAAAAAMCGTEPVRSWLLSTLPVPRGQVAAAVAARTSADPFEAMRASGRPTDEELRQRASSPASHQVRLGPTMPPTVDRVAALEQPAQLSSKLTVAPDTIAALESELRPFEDRLRRRFVDELLTGTWGA